VQASDNPVKARFVPLGEFITRVGPPPSDVAMVTYLQRLKEQGWNVDRTERKMLMCGVNIGDTKADANALAGESNCWCLFLWAFVFMISTECQQIPSQQHILASIQLSLQTVLPAWA
jgi:hypothetical protein